MTRIRWACLCMLLVVLLGGCARTESAPQLVVANRDKGVVAPTEGQAAKKTIALVMKTLTNPFFVGMEKGARRAESELGINLIKTGAQETSIDQQIAIVEDLIRSRVDAIVIAPGSSTDLVPVLKRAQDARITIVNIDNRLNPEACQKLGLTGIPFISVNNEQGAYLSAKFVADQISTPTEVAILEGIREATNAGSFPLGC